MILTLSSVFTVTMTFNATEVSGSTSGVWKDWDDNKITWTFDGVDKLTFSGNGKVQNEETGLFNGDEELFKVADKVKSIYFQDGITEVSYPMSDFSNIKTVVMADTITYTSYELFSGCDKLENVTLSKNLEEVKGFKSCDSLKSINIPSGIKAIGSGAFEYCSNLSSVNIPDTVEEIQSDAFVFCKSLSNIVIPDSVKKIGESAFNSCYSLTNVTLPKDVDVISSGLFYYCDSLETVNYSDKVKKIGNNAFYNCKKLKSVKIPDNMTKIGEGTFEGCSSITSIKLPSKLKTIEKDAFKGCKSLKSISIPKTVTSIGKSAFRNCQKISKISIPTNVTKIKDNTFYGCKGLKTVNISKNITDISSYAFGACTGLKSINVDKNNKKYTTVNGSVYNKKKDTLVIYPCGRTSSYTVAKGTKYIDKKSFLGATVKKVVLPNTVKKIYSEAFAQCENLNNIYIPSSVTYIAPGAFKYSKYYNTEKYWSDGQLYVSNCVVESRENVKKANIKSGTRLIASGTYKGRRNLKSVTLPKSIKYINSNAFLNCNKLNKMTLPSSLKSIGNRAIGYVDVEVSTDYASYPYIKNQMTLIKDDLSLKVYKNTVGYKYAVKNVINYKTV